MRLLSSPVRSLAVPCLLLTSMLLAGCQSNGASKLTPVNLPAPPACMAPVPVPLLAAGDDARLALARYRAATASANGNLVCSRTWYEGVRKGYGTK